MRYLQFRPGCIESNVERDYSVEEGRDSSNTYHISAVERLLCCARSILYSLTCRLVCIVVTLSLFSWGRERDCVVLHACRRRATCISESINTCRLRFHERRRSLGGRRYWQSGSLDRASIALLSPLENFKSNKCADRVWVYLVSPLAT